jgi:tRNA (guanosine-2'-O-)-methyltransferase
VVLENIHDPHNVSAILRSADAVGILGVQLLYTTATEQFPKMGKKSSASALKWVTRRPFRTVEECYAALRREGFAIYATHMGKRSKSLYELDLTGNVALVFGNEHRGVSEEAARLADENFLIPMTGMIQSLNVSVACAVSLYETFRQRQASGNAPHLDPATIERLYEEWAGK